MAFNKLYGLWLAQNEADIIEATLSHFRQNKYYDKIFFYDLNSTDKTFEIAQQFPDVVHDPKRIDAPFSGRLKFDLLNDHRSLFKEGDWISIVDSDEIYTADPRPLLEAAEKEGASGVEGEFAFFYFTDVDRDEWMNGDAAFRAKPACDRLRHYIIEWSEHRFYKFNPNSGSGWVIDPEAPLFSKRLLIKHYPHRSPTQLQSKIEQRRRNSEHNRRVGHVDPHPHIFSTEWSDYVVDHKLLHKYDGEFKFGVPDGVNWRSFYNLWANDSASWRNVAYNNHYIHWMIGHGYIPKWSPPAQVARAFGRLVQRIRGRHRVRSTKARRG